MWKRRIAGGFLGIVGFMLSPLSWWNDLFINVPLAVGFGSLIGLIYKPAFSAAVVVGYWLTNVLGFVLMHKGAQVAINSEPKPYTRRDLAKDFGISFLYTLLIVVLIRCKVLQPVSDYFSQPG